MDILISPHYLFHDRLCTLLYSLLYPRVGNGGYLRALYRQEEGQSDGVAEIHEQEHEEEESHRADYERVVDDREVDQKGSDELAEG